MAMIEVEHLSKSYGRIEAVRDVSFSIERGEIVGFLGPNGAGKTTIMRVLTGFLEPTSGTVRLGGEVLSDRAIHLRRRIGYLPENVALYDDMTAEEFLRFVARAKGLSGAAVADHVNRVAVDCGVSEVRRRLVGKLSKGYRQRVALSAALVGSPEILIFDEPTTGLDPRQIIEIRTIIKNLRGERTVILSTHILPEVSTLCERVLVMNEGRIVASDRLEALESRFAERQEIELTVRGSAEAAESALRAVPGVLEVRALPGDEGASSFLVAFSRGRDLRPEVARACVKGGLELLELREARVSLEEIFVKLVTESGSSEGVS